jgi:UDP-N-acetylenolpyruvoylglucosamine reductase
VVGRGSNLLIADAGWPGVVLHLGQRFRRIEIDGTEMEVGAATPLPGLAARSAAASLGGIAFAVAIPGSVGGGVRMNAGAHGTELADRLVWADVLQLTDPEGSGEPHDGPAGRRSGPVPPTGAGEPHDGPAGRRSGPVPPTGAGEPRRGAPVGRGPVGRAGQVAAAPPAGPVRLKPDQLGFGYRRSALPPGAVVTAARFALAPAQEAAVRAEIDEARRWRRDNQPVNQPNCGSVFANPPEMAAGRALELLGMKGERCGGAQVSQVHANFIVAADGASSADVLALIRRAMRRARDQLGVTLRTEVQLVGEFGGEPR